jgi:hypothetical protein
MLSRPMLQMQQLEYDPVNSSVYSTWTGTSLYVGFKLEGIEAPMNTSAGNYAEYQLRRAWGEDVCELLIQPLYADNSVGPLVHIACKPHGQLDVSRRLDPRQHANPWQAFSSTDIRYWATHEKPVWRGEVAIPWEALNDDAHRGAMPLLLRFNFSQHRGATGQSSSWAGPVDFGRDDALMGLLYLKK